MVGVRLIGITKSDNGDALYGLALTPAAQEAIFKKSKKRKITTEEYLRICIENYILKKEKV